MNILINKNSIPLDFPSIKPPPISVLPSDPLAFSYITDLYSITNPSVSLSDYFYQELPPNPHQSLSIKNEIIKNAIVNEKRPTYLPIENKNIQPNSIVFGKCQDMVLENDDPRYNTEIESNIEESKYDYIDKIYRKVNIKLTKLGLDDFDFSLYNKYIIIIIIII